MSTSSPSSALGRRPPPACGRQRQRRRADGGRGADVTLVWGLPLVRGAVPATTELDGEPLDQVAVRDGRFTLVAVDAVHGFGDDLYLEVKLWDRRVREIASESLYDEPEPEPGGEAQPGEDG